MLPISVIDGPQFDYIQKGNPTIDVNPRTLYATWLNVTTGELFICINPTKGDNVWKGQLGTTVATGSGIYFNGVDAYADNTERIYNWASSWTITFNTDTTYGTGSVGYGHGNDDPYYSWNITAGEHLNISAYDGTSRHLSSNATLTKGLHTVGVTYNGSSKNVQLFIDGVLDTNGTVGARTRTDRYDAFVVGSSRALGLSPIEGSICNIKIWDHVLTTVEIQQYSNAVLTGSETGLVAYYKIDEREGSTLIDSAGDNNLTIHNATWL
jgi:hypothetical protein